MGAESKVQAYARRLFKKRGCLFHKIRYEGVSGAPDCMVGVPCLGNNTAKVIFIEFKKSEDTLPKPHQIREHEKMRKVGMLVYVIGSITQVDNLLGELFNGD